MPMPFLFSFMILATFLGSGPSARADFASPICIYRQAVLNKARTEYYNYRSEVDQRNREAKNSARDRPLKELAKEEEKLAQLKERVASSSQSCLLSCGEGFYNACRE